MTKPYAASFDEEANVVRVRVTGSATHEDHCAVRDEAIKLCETNGCLKLLIDLRKLCTERSSTMSCFSFGENLAKIPLRIRIAHVLPTDAKSAEDVRFTSSVESNRGKITGEFHNIQEAEQWLLGG
jgi:hypothetical protein